VSCAGLYAVRRPVDECTERKRGAAAWVKSFWANHAAAMQRYVGMKPVKPLAPMIKALKDEQVSNKTNFAKADSHALHAANVKRHAALGEKITAAISRRELSAEEAATLESRWHHNGRRLELVGPQIGAL
jgi:hypothetical protein